MNGFVLSAKTIAGNVSHLAVLLSSQTVVPNVALRAPRCVSTSNVRTDEIEKVETTVLQILLIHFEHAFDIQALGDRIELFVQLLQIDVCGDPDG